MSATDGRVVAECTRPTDVARGAQAIVAELIQLSRDCIARVESENPGDKVIGIGIGVPGPLDIRRGVVLLTPNLGWNDLPLRDLVSEGVGLPTVLDNDANCAILGESWVGAARDARFAIGFTIGTGIGGGIVFEGRLHHGISDCAGEIGHVTIEMDGRPCGCGNHGCLEAYASGPAIARRAAERMKPGSILASLVDSDSSRITAETVYRAARQNDEVALDTVHETARYLGAGVAGMLNIFNPDCVVIMGGVTGAGRELFEPLQREVAERAFRPAVEACRIIPGSLSGMAGVIGAARAYLDHVGAPR